MSEEEELSQGGSEQTHVLEVTPEVQAGKQPWNAVHHAGRLEGAWQVGEKQQWTECRQFILGSI